MAKLFLDVNIPMYAAGRKHRYKEACVWVMTQVAEGGIVAVTDTEAIQEVLYRYGALQHWQIGVAMANSLMNLVPEIYPVNVDDMHRSLDLFKRYAQKGITARDVVHAAVMMNRGLKNIVSTDSHFDLIKGITRVDPEDLYRQRA